MPIQNFSNRLSDLSNRMDEVINIINDAHTEIVTLYSERFGFWYGADPDSSDIYIKIREIYIGHAALAHRLEIDELTKAISACDTTPLCV